ncbi:hypothetical protein [Jiella sp. M17.18]
MFSTALTRHQVSGELRRLEDALASRVKPPLYQDAETGRLVLPSDYVS